MTRIVTNATSMMTQTVSTTADQVSCSLYESILRIKSSREAQKSGISTNRHSAPESMVRGTLRSRKTKISKQRKKSATMGNPNCQNQAVEGVR